MSDGDASDNVLLYIERDRPSDRLEKAIGPHSALRVLLHILGCWSNKVICAVHVMVNILLCAPPIVAHIYSHVYSIQHNEELNREDYENDGTVLALVLVTIIHIAPLVLYCLAVLIVFSGVLTKAIEMVNDCMDEDYPKRENIDTQVPLKEIRGQTTNYWISKMLVISSLLLALFIGVVCLDAFAEPDYGPDNMLTFLSPSSQIRGIIYVMMEGYPYILLLLISVVVNITLRCYDFRLKQFPNKMEQLSTDENGPFEVNGELFRMTRDQTRADIFCWISRFFNYSLLFSFAVPAVYAHYHFSLRANSADEWLESSLLVTKSVLAFLPSWAFTMWACVNISDSSRAIAEKAKEILTRECEENHQRRWAVVLQFLSLGPYTGFYVTTVDVIINRSQSVIFIQGYIAALVWLALSNLNDFRISSLPMSGLNEADHVLSVLHNMTSAP
ncbi:uncharacterized protein LOC144351324 [Saccoglossus kowalevskii]